MRQFAAILIALACAAPPSTANGCGPHSAVTPQSATVWHRKATPNVARDSRGHIARNTHAKGEFRKSHPCPSTGKRTGACPGYVIDHMTALKRGGADAAYNMQWQSTEQAKEKDRWE